MVSKKSHGKYIQRRGFMVTNEVLNTILSRKGVKQYKSNPVPRELLEAIVAAGSGICFSVRPAVRNLYPKKDSARFQKGSLVLDTSSLYRKSSNRKWPYPNGFSPWSPSLPPEPFSRAFLSKLYSFPPRICFTVSLR